MFLLFAFLFLPFAVFGAEVNEEFDAVNANLAAYLLHDNRQVDVRLPIEGFYQLINSARNTGIRYSSKVKANRTCIEDLARILFDLIEARKHLLKELWLLRLIDSYGKPESNILEGNIRWTGGFRECIEVQEPNNKFTGKYCKASWSLGINTTFDGNSVSLMSGICVPNSCDSEDILLQYRTLELIITHIPFFNQYVTKVTPKLLSVDCLEDTPLDSNAISYLSVVLVFVLVAVLGTTADLWRRKYYVNGYRTLAAEQNPSVNDSNNESIIIAAEDQIVVMREVDGSTNSNCGFTCLRILSAFSVYTNFKNLFDTSKSNSQLRCIHGIRFLSIAWIIIGHTYAFSAIITANMLQALKDIDNLPFFTILNASFSVDTFFVMSGFLLSYLFLAEAEQRPLCSFYFWIRFYLHRIWRLTPVYAIILWFDTGVAHYCGSGPFWDYGYSNDSERMRCVNHWWTNLLYINNFWKALDNCMMWTWYLANDMQFYVISPIFLVLLAKLPVFGIAVTIAVAIGSWTLTTIISYDHNFSVLFGSGLSVSNVTVNVTGIEHEIDQAMDYLNLYYVKPWCRIAPYLIGLLAGYLLSSLSKRSYKLEKYTVLLGSLVATTLGLLVLYGPYHATLTRLEAALYNGLARSAWGLAVSWLILVCLMGKGGFVNKMLSWKCWIPLSRLTYCAYLLHPILINAYLQNFKTPFMFSHTNVMAVVGSALFYVFLVSIVFTLLFEVPLLEFEKKLFPKNEAN